MSLSEINLRERKFHNQLHSSGGEDRTQQNKFYKALYSLQVDFLDSLKTKTKSKDVLDYGCGIGNFAEKVKSFQPKKWQIRPGLWPKGPGAKEGGGYLCADL